MVLNTAMPINTMDYILDDIDGVLVITVILILNEERRDVFMEERIIKRILCYGDSNTHGYLAPTGDRYAEHERWTGILQDLLGAEYRIIEEGLGGRTTVIDDALEDYLNGKKLIIPCIKTHYPVDLIIIMLGTNDMKTRFGMSPWDIARGAGVVAQMAIDWTRARSKTNTPAKILLVSPILISEAMETSPFAEDFGYLEAHEKSKMLASRFQRVADNLGVYFMDAALITPPCDEDAIHLNKEGHLALAKEFAKRIKEIFETESE